MDKKEIQRFYKKHHKNILRLVKSSGMSLNPKSQSGQVLKTKSEKNKKGEG